MRHRDGEEEVSSFGLAGGILRLRRRREIVGEIRRGVGSVDVLGKRLRAEYNPKQFLLPCVLLSLRSPLVDLALGVGVDWVMSIEDGWRKWGKRCVGHRLCAVKLFGLLVLVPANQPCS